MHSVADPETRWEEGKTVEVHNGFLWSRGHFFLTYFSRPHRKAPFPWFATEYFMMEKFPAHASLLQGPTSRIFLGQFSYRRITYPSLSFNSSLPPVSGYLRRDPFTLWFANPDHSRTRKKTLRPLEPKCPELTWGFRRDEYFDSWDENRCQRLDLFQRPDEPLAVNLVRQLLLAAIHILGHLCQNRTQVLKSRIKGTFTPSVWDCDCDIAYRWFQCISMLTISQSDQWDQNCRVAITDAECQTLDVIIVFASMSIASKLSSKCKTKNTSRAILYICVCITQHWQRSKFNNLC